MLGISAAVRETLFPSCGPARPTFWTGFSRPPGLPGPRTSAISGRSHGMACTFSSCYVRVQKGLWHRFPSGRSRAPDFLKIVDVLGRCPWAPGRLSYFPGPILRSVFLWRCLTFSSRSRSSERPHYQRKRNSSVRALIHKPLGSGQGAQLKFLWVF